MASKLGISEESVRRWRRKAQVDAGERPGVTSSEHAEIRKLKRDNAELRRANEVLKSASGVFRSGALRHEARGVSGGGERPSPLGRRSGLMKRRGGRSPGANDGRWQAAPRRRVVSILSDGAGSLSEVRRCNVGESVSDAR